MTWLRWCLVAVTAIMTFAALLAPARPDSTWRCHGEPTAYGVDDCTLADMAWFADDEQIPLWTAVRKYGWQSTFSQDVDRLKRANPESYAAASSGDHPTVWFKGAPPQGIETAFDNLPVWVRVTVRSAPYTAAATETIQSVAGDAVDALDNYNEFASLDTDESTGVVTLELSAENGAVQTDIRAMEAGIESALREHLPDLDTPDVRVRVVPYSPLVLY